MYEINFSYYRDIPLRLLRRREQGKETLVTGEKCLWNREKTRSLPISSGRGRNQQRPLLISAAGGDYIGSGRCVPLSCSLIRISDLRSKVGLLGNERKMFFFFAFHSIFTIFAAEKHALIVKWI